MDKSPHRPTNSPNRTQIARIVFAAAESMGIADRRLVERLTSQVIKRLEQNRSFLQPPTLPGMEDLVARSPRRPSILPTDTDILTMVEEILAVEEQKFTEEAPAEMKTTKTASTKSQPDTGPKLTENARHVLQKRYLKKDKQGNVIETPDEMFRRVARAIAEAELLYKPRANVKAIENEFYRIMTSLEFLPNSPTLMNAGRELGQLSACFVLPIEDSMESIFDSVKNTALIHKSGGGTGFSFSRLRPERDRVGSTGGVASGPVSFIRAFDIATDVIKQGGMRRGANMGILNVDHPDIMKFITSKEDMTALTNFNISVAVTSEFMKAVKAGGDYNLINPHTREVDGRLNAKEVFDKIVDMAWKTGDPGIVFIDRINQDNPTPHLGKIESTNPCGEQPLLPYESCNLGSVNLATMLRQGDGAVEIDYPRLAKTIKTAVRFLDNVIDVNKFPLPQIEEMTRKTRKIGFGVMGFADMLIQLGIPYNSEKALTIAEELMAHISHEATNSSVELGKERGLFPAFAGSIYDVPDAPRVRNASRTTIAPTGTLSMIAGCSSGIEPLFALSYTKNILDGAKLVEVNPYFEEIAREKGFYSDELMQKLADGVHLADIEGVPDDVKSVLITAHEITPEWHVKMQAAFQKSTNNAVSKTVNFPHEATREDVAEVYMLAYEEGLKGITIYRDGSRDAQVLTTGKTEEKTEEGRRTPRKRAKVTSGFTERVTTGCGYIYVTVNSDENGICEVFSHLGKTGGCASAQLEATCRLISLALRSGVDVASVVRQLRGIRCPSIAWEEGKSILSCADAIASVLEKHTTGYDGKPKPEDYGLAKNLAGQCPECSNMLIYQEGCFICPACGYTKC
ncbi:MAG: vitamin B12-dependent ribonucleotide reductase [Dehalococcoidia bacterium]|nr:MAG: vitamin B12-dependent ribonucleotide reductase [Dehalococcoidia bacterium]